MMRKHVTFVATVAASFVVAINGFGVSDAVLAGEACIEEPTHLPAEGTHWYYHFDRANHRKCWYLGIAGTTVLATPPPQPDPPRPPTFRSVFPSLFGEAVIAAAPQDAAREPRIIQPNPTRTLKADDIVQKRQPSFPEERPDRRYAPRMKPEKHDALFQEFLRWDETMRTTGGRPPTQSP